MIRILLGVVVGFIAWSIIWIGSDQLFYSISPEWYARQKDAMALAFANTETFSPDTTLALVDIARSIVASIMSGFLTAVVAGENRRSPLLLGLVLLAVGVMVEYFIWGLYPVWYHLFFLLALIPAAMLGGRMIRKA